MSRRGFIEGQPIFWLAVPEKKWIELWGFVEVNGVQYDCGRYITREAFETAIHPETLVHHCVRQIEAQLGKEVTS